MSNSSIENNCESYIFFLRDGESLSNSESDLISRINKIANRFLEDLDFRSEVFNFINPKYDDEYKKIAALSYDNNFIKWNSNISLYELTDISYNANIQFDKFKRIVSEQNICVIFSLNKFANIEDFYITKESLESYLSYPNDKYVSLTYEIIKKDIDCFNGFLNKVDFSVPIYQKYVCMLNGFPLVAELSYLGDFEAEYFAELLIILHIKEILKKVDGTERLAEEEYQNRLNELIIKAENCVNEIIDNLSKDNTFRNLDKENAGRYYKTYVKKYINNLQDYGLRNQILKQLGLFLNINGEVVFRGYEGRQIIENILKSK